ncbi:exonuclease domain-containing protein [Pollutimonas bauzanensis]|uniref:DNA polymerase-3 subunit epsilon n=1 Tax=Pollutimonas bauzanensis TaxID=658167 RepID=A0A1M5ZWT0_9BURK|nr:exonuclease domain-containing protein [Pollutimonas bauzanensis]SHI28700.1 DNA polymerase-3 subunit epsilon [Pollutimonas bauzanensis]
MKNSIEIGLVLDTETTGLRSSDELIEYAHVMFSYDKASGEVVDILDEYCEFREPSVPIGRTAQKVNGISMDMVRGRFLDETRIAGAMLAARKIYAHNMGFDRRFVSGLYPGLQNLHWVCTMSNINWLAQGVRSRKLDDILSFYGISDGARHRALDDAKGTLSAIQRRDVQTGLPHIVALAKNRKKLLTQYPGVMEPRQC